ncbi:MAG: hypothetical protein GX548_10875 [Lentisphaerae bacterium]|nr:hypothetical protein [Lentisphaerota bacterium]
MKKTVGGWLIGMLALVGTAMGQDMRDVTFSVDMSVQIGLGNFDPDTMGVDVRGDFNTWGQTALTREGETGIYFATISVAGAEADPVGYKFYYNNGGDVWENDPNRSFNLGPAGTPQVLDTVYFNNQGPAGPSVTADVTFSVDMSVQIGLGNFDPETMGVDVRGDFNTWGQTALTREGETALYSALISVTAPDGSTVGYKFFYDNGEATESEIWENDPNRTFVMSEDPQVLDTVYFNNEEPPSGLQLSGTWNPATTGAYEFIVTRSGPEIGDEIQLSVDNELAASVPATVTFAEGSDEAAFDVTVLSLVEGNVTVTAEDSVSGDFAEYSIQMPRMEISGPFQVFAAGPASYTLTRFNNISGTVNLSSTNPAVMTVPATATFDGENAETTFQGMALAEGSTTLVATDPVSGVSSAFNVTFAAPSLALHGPDSAWIGTTPTYTLTRSGPIGEVVQLTSSDGAVLQVPETVTFGFEEDVVTFQAQALAEGTAQLGAGNADATAAPLGVTVSERPDYWAYDDASLYAGGVWELSPAHESGFPDWTETLSSETNNAFRGRFIGESAVTAINQGGLAFGLYANWSEAEPDPLPEIKMTRGFPAPMAVGQTFSVDVAYNYSSGAKGFKLKGEFEGVAYDRFELFNSGNDTWSYKFDGNDATITVIWDGYLAGGFMGSIQVVCTAPNTFNFGFQRAGGDWVWVNDVSLPGTIDQVEFYNFNGGSGDAENFYFNRMWLTAPDPALDLTGPWDLTATGDYEYTLTRLGEVGDTIHLSSDNEAAVTVPATVTFAAGEDTVTFMATVASLTNGEAVLRAEDPLGTAWSEFAVRPREVGPGVVELAYDPATGTMAFLPPDGYEIGTLEAADCSLDAEGNWQNWRTLVIDTDYTVDGEGRISLLTGNQAQMILRITWVRPL